MKLLRRALLLFLSTSFAFAEKPIAIEHARVFDGTGKPAYTATVLVENGRIAAIGAHLTLPQEALRIDAAGKTLLPGLFDVHTHLNASAGPFPADWQKNAAAYLICGVTTIDEFSANRAMYAPLRKLIAGHTYLTPHINFATRISTPGGHGAESGMGEFTTVEVNTPASAHLAMQSILAARPDVIKVFTDGWRYDAEANLSNMNRETLAAIVEDAHRAGIKVLTHTVTVEGARIAAAAGVDVIAHSIQDAPVDPALVALMKTHGTFYAPTLAVYEPRRPAQATPLYLSVVDPRLKEAVNKAIASGKFHDDDPLSAKHWQLALGNLRTLHAAGIPVILGTDNGMSFTPHGWGSLHELELLVSAGFTPAQALESGTRLSAQALGLIAERGTIEVGKQADLVLVDGRPDETITEIEKIDSVWLAGVPIDRAVLLARIESPQSFPLPVLSLPAQVDDMERPDGSTLIGTLKYPTTDYGADHSRLLLQQVARPEGGHAWLLTARFGPKQQNFVHLNLPLTPGEISLADLSSYHGIAFDLRGEGSFRLLLNQSPNHGRRSPAAPILASPAWKHIVLPFSAFFSDDGSTLDLKQMRALVFEATGPAGSSAWFELDNVTFD